MTAPLGPAVPLAELEGEPYALLARLRETEPVAWMPALDGWLVTRRDLALDVMRDAASFTVDDPRFSTGRVLGPSMLTRDGAAHARHRAPFARPFRLADVRERFGAVVEREAERLLDVVAADGRAELRTAYAAPLATAVVTYALGLGGTDVAAVLRWYEAIVGAVTEVSAGRPVGPAGPEAFGALGAAIEAVLDRDDVDSLVAAAQGDAAGLSRAEVVSNAAVLLFGGIETTEGMIASALWHLLTHPDALALVATDRSLIPAAVEESLRLEPAAARVDRYATRTVELGGATIGAGDLVIVSITAANRDPAAFADPDRFDVRRADARSHLAFAGGPHVCIAMHLARLEAHTAVAGVLERLPGLRLDPARPVTPPRGLVFRKPPAVDAVWRTS